MLSRQGDVVTGTESIRLARLSSSVTERRRRANGRSGLLEIAFKTASTAWGIVVSSSRRDNSMAALLSGDTGVMTPSTELTTLPSVRPRGGTYMSIPHLIITKLRARTHRTAVFAVIQFLPLGE